MRQDRKPPLPGISGNGRPQTDPVNGGHILNVDDGVDTVEDKTPMAWGDVSVMIV